jgi:hypothetical protein
MPGPWAGSAGTACQSLGRIFLAVYDIGYPSVTSRGARRDKLHMIYMRRTDAIMDAVQANIHPFQDLIIAAECGPSATCISRWMPCFTHNQKVFSQL